MILNMNYLKLYIIFTVLNTIRGDSTTEAATSTTEGTAEEDKPPAEEKLSTTTQVVAVLTTTESSGKGTTHQTEPSATEEPSQDKAEDSSKGLDASKDEDDSKTEPSPKDEDNSEVSSPWDLLPKNCGKNRFEKLKQVRIIDGEKAKLGEFPWMARLGIKIYPYGLMFDCGGSLITKYYVVSAAHCGSYLDTVRLGENYIFKNPDCDEDGNCAPKPQDIPISRIIFQDYCREQSRNDLMLVELKTAAEFNDYVQPLCLPRTPIVHETFLNQSTVIAGFGLVNSKGLEPEQLMYVNNQVIDPKECQVLFGKTMEVNQFCIGTPKYVKSNGTCMGDSGGPVMKDMEINGEMRTHVIGAVSFGSAECEFGPAVYTDVTYFGEWIVNQIKKH